MSPSCRTLRWIRQGNAIICVNNQWAVPGLIDIFSSMQWPRAPWRPFVARAIKLFIAAFCEPPLGTSPWQRRCPVSRPRPRPRANGRTDGRIRISIPSKCKGKGKSTSPPRWLELETEGDSNYKELRLGKYATIANLMPPPHAVNVASAEIIEKFKYFKASAEGIKCQTG